MDDFYRALFFLIFSINIDAHFDSPEVKILIGEQLSDIYVSGTDLERTIIPRSEHKIHSGRHTLHVRCHQILTKQDKNTLPYLKISSPTNSLIWNKKPYRGEFLVAEGHSKKYCTLINQLNLEGYISSLLAKEMNGTWTLEALKAQAVAARTYALYKIQERQKNSQKNSPDTRPFDLINSEMDQVTGNIMDETTATAMATKSTRGEILALKTGEMTPIFYSAKCGGKTLLPEQVWGEKIKGLSSVQCPYCKNHGKKKWSFRIDLDEMKRLVAKAFKLQFGKKIAANSINLAPNELMQPEINFYGGQGLESIPKAYLRRFLGGDKLYSNHYSFRLQNKTVDITGEGLGHGVGMCQLGALEMANRGMNYQQILAFYFPNHKIKKAYQ